MSFITEKLVESYKLLINTACDTNTPYEFRVHAAQEVHDNLELMSMSSVLYPSFVEHIVKNYKTLFAELEPTFITDDNKHVLKKLVIDSLSRLPHSECLRQYAEPLVTLGVKAIEIDNEEIVCSCMRVVIDLTKDYRPPYNNMHITFLKFAKRVYVELPDRVYEIFKIRQKLVVNNLYELDLQTILSDLYSSIKVQVGFVAGKLTMEDCTILPRGSMSLKILQEIPVITVMLYQLYKDNVKGDFVDLIPNIIKFLTLRPLQEVMTDPNFDKEVFVEFMMAQVRSLSFLAYITRIYQDVMATHSGELVEGLLNMLRLCPKEVTSLRRDLFIACRHLFGTELKIVFVPYVDEFFDESVLLNTGWTTRESLRPLAFSTLADFVHHIRQHLKMPTLVKAINLYVLNVHDESLPIGICSMSCKLLLNLVECIQQQSKPDSGVPAEQSGHYLLMKMLKVCLLKFKTVVKIHIPTIHQRWKQSLEQQQGQSNQSPQAQDTSQGTFAGEPSLEKTETPSKFTQYDTAYTDRRDGDKDKNPIFPLTQQHIFTLSDCKSLVRFLTHAVKSITFAAVSLMGPSDDENRNSMMFSPKDVNLYIRLIKWAIRSFEVYYIVPPIKTNQKPRSKEDVEVIEHFTGIFAPLHPHTFKEIFSVCMESYIEHYTDHSYMFFINDTFLINRETSLRYATCLMDFLMKRLPDMGNENQEKSCIYLKLFKSVFDSVAAFQSDHDQILGPVLHQLVLKSMDMSITAVDPTNYFLLLRSLFRSIGGGNHELLYQEFLPLLSTVLQNLNFLQSGIHKKNIRDLFVELCLTVPVRLSSLLPYLPLLMVPLVAALNGSPSLISQGLRTIELCVDNLQPDFLSDQFHPVRADLMQSLWHILNNQTDQIAAVAFRLLGKLGGGNRKMMNEPQKLDYQMNRTNNPAVVIHFIDYGSPINLCLQKTVEVAVNTLQGNTTDIFYRRQCWFILKGFLLGSIGSEEYNIYRFLTHPSFTENAIPDIPSTSLYRYSQTVVRNTHVTALTGVFIAAATKELSRMVIPTLVAIVRHYTLLAIAQQAGPVPMVHNQDALEGTMDSLILADAIITVMGYEEKELCKPGRLALAVMVGTATTILGTKKRACELSFMSYLVEKACSLCYERPWYSKLGGCEAIRFFFHKMSPHWVCRHLYTFMKAQLFVMMDLSGEVSNGVVDQAKSNLEEMVRKFAPLVDKNEDPELASLQATALFEITYELTRQITSPNDYLREESMHLLRVFAEVQNKSITEVMECHRAILADIIPPKKHLLRHQAANCQIGLMEGHTFCTMLEPRLFTLDLSISEHKMFFQEVCGIIETQEHMLMKLPCFKSVPSLLPLKKSAMKALAACHYVPSSAEKIFNLLYQTIERTEPELQEAAFECMRTFVAGSTIDLAIVHEVMRPLLATFFDHRNVDISGARKLCYLVKLFPGSFKDKLCEQLLTLLENFFDLLIQPNQKDVTLTSKEIHEIICILIDIFHHVPAARSRFVEVLCVLVITSEKTLCFERSSPFRAHLVNFLLRYPDDTVALFMQDKYLKEYEWGSYLHYLLKHNDGKRFRDVFSNSKDIPEKIITLINATKKMDGSLTTEEKWMVRYQTIKAMYIVIKFNDQWFISNEKITKFLLSLWAGDTYQEMYKNITAIPHIRWNEPRLVVSLLLHYYINNPMQIDVLFQILSAFSFRSLLNFNFLTTFLEEVVAQEYTVEWKRMVFFRFVAMFNAQTMSDEMKRNVLQYVIIPCFTASFEKGEVEKLITGSNMSVLLNPEENVIYVLLNKLIGTRGANSFQNDEVRLMIQHLACIMIEYAHTYIALKTDGNRLRILMEFVWHCMDGKKCVDSITEYHGHLLLCHIISKMKINKKIILQVFRSLLRANAAEARNVVRHALDIITPLVPTEIEDGYRMLTHWTLKIMLEEGQSMAQLSHVLGLINRHYKTYYPVRHKLVHVMIHCFHRLALSSSSPTEHRKLMIDLLELLVKWELQRVRDESENKEGGSADDIFSPPPRKRHTGGSSGNNAVFLEECNVNKPFDKAYVEVIMSHLTKFACQTSEMSVSAAAMESFARRSMSIIKTAIKSEIWPDCSFESRANYLDKILSSVHQANPSISNVCAALELITFTISVMKKEDILSLVKSLQNGLNLCIMSTNTKIVKYIYSFLSRLMAIFPVEPATSPVASPHEELDKLYNFVSKITTDGFGLFEKNSNASSSSLYSSIMLLKAGCVSNQSYIDRYIVLFVRVLHRLVREQSVGVCESVGPSDLMGYSLEMLKNRIGLMKIDTRKMFMGIVISGIIERTPDTKLMRLIMKLLEEWMMTGNNPGYCGPNIQEKSALLVKVMHAIEKRFNNELSYPFLEIIYNILKEESKKPTELIASLETAFLTGLRCSNSVIRSRFFLLLDSSIQRRLIYRLLYIVSSQNWSSMMNHFWLKQCVELLLITSVPDERIQLADGSGILPSITCVIENADVDRKNDILNYLALREEQSETGSVSSIDTSIDDIDIELADTISQSSVELMNKTGGETLSQVISRQFKFLNGAREFKTVELLKAVSQLCHTDTLLTEQIWINMFPQIWSILHDRERMELIGEIAPFVVSGSHSLQKDRHPSAMGVFYEGLARCNPPVAIKPQVMTYLAQTHNLWHRVTLTLEKMTFESNFFKDKQSLSSDCYDFEPDTIPQQDIIDNLTAMYCALNEEDMWCAVWQKHAKHPETVIAVTYEQQGFFEKALGAYELALGKARQSYANSPSPVTLISEMRLWEFHWIRCSKELNQWDHLTDYTKTKEHFNPVLMMDTSWRSANWDALKETISQVESHFQGHLSWKLDLYKGYHSICNTDTAVPHQIDRHIEQSNLHCIKEWRRLPRVVSNANLPLLHAAQLIVELQEAYHIKHSLISGRSTSLHDIKSIIKTWCNRMPIISDDLSHWNDVFSWRKIHYQFITKYYESTSDANKVHNVIGVHASAQAVIYFGKIARKHGLTALCLDSISKLYNIPSVPIVDCFQKIRQQVKCYLQLSAQFGNDQIQEGLEAIEQTNMRYLTKEMTAEIYALKGLLLFKLGRNEEANRSFSVSVQMHDTLVKGWAYWGEFMENQFINSSPIDMNTGLAAIICFLHACKNQPESKSRKYLAKVLWLQTYDDEGAILTDGIERYNSGVPPTLWLLWLPQLLTVLSRAEGKNIGNIVTQVGRMFPQAVYFPVRTMYFTQKLEQRERYKLAEKAIEKPMENFNEGSNIHLLGSNFVGNSSGISTSQDKAEKNEKDGFGAQLRATPAMLRCSKIMQLQREIHPTILLSLEGIVDQMVWFRENWCEEVLKQLRLGLQKCYSIAFESRDTVSDAVISTSTHNFLKKLVATFGIGLEMYANPTNSSFGNAGSESLGRRAQITMSDPAFQSMKQKFAEDFDFSAPDSMKLHSFISKMKKWIKLLEQKIKALPKSFLIEDKCRFLSNFNLQTAETELPGEFLLPKVGNQVSHYYVKIARFMPRVEIAEKHNSAVRRLYIRGHNGKIYPYLIMQDYGIDARREEITLQLMRMLNHYLTKQKETLRRCLCYTVSRVVAVSPQLRLVEDNPASLSLQDICKHVCSKKNISYDEPIAKYYERLASLQSKGGQTNHQVLRDILLEAQMSCVPTTLLKNWAVDIYKTPTDYWSFRKVFTIQLSLCCFAEYVFNFSRLNPDMMFIHQDTGLINVAYYKFDVDIVKTELEGCRAVPFRLTPNLSELITEIGISGPLVACMLATARCFSYSNYKLPDILKTLLKDEMSITFRRKYEEEREVVITDLNNPPADVPGELIVTTVNRAVDSIMQKMNSLINFDGADSKVASLVNAARNVDNLCRMDPAWHPWL